MVAAPEPLEEPVVSAEETKRSAWRDRVWVTSTYFAEGYPYTVVNNLAEILFKALGASLEAVGLTALFHLPWNLKFLWGPFVDHYETKRRWLVGMEILCTAVLVAVAFVLSAGAFLGALSALFLVLAVLSATHDIAIDGFYLEGLDEEGQSRFVGFRAMAYRLATMLLTGPGLVFIGWVGWKIGFIAMALLMAGLTFLHARLLPPGEERKAPIRDLLAQIFRFRVLMIGAVVAGVVVAERQLGFLAGAGAALVAAVPTLGRISFGGYVALGLVVGLVALLLLRKRLGARFAESDYGAAFVDFLDQPRVAVILGFVCTFRTGESFLMKMKWPFLDDVLHLPLEMYGFANGTVGLVASFSATLLGGWLIARHGLRRWIWPFVLGQNLLNLLYVGLASGWFGASPGLATITTVITLERIGEGLGTAVFMVYLMRCCDARHKAAHMAILTALMSIGFTVAGAVSGFLASAMGFANYFLLSFVATFPGMVLLFFVPHLDGRESLDPPAAAA